MHSTELKESAGCIPLKYDVVPDTDNDRSFAVPLCLFCFTISPETTYISFKMVNASSLVDCIAGIVNSTSVEVSGSIWITTLRKGQGQLSSRCVIPKPLSLVAETIGRITQ